MGKILAGLGVLCLLAPQGVVAQGEATGGVETQVVEVEVEEVREEQIEVYEEGQTSLVQELRVKVVAGERAGEVLVVDVNRLLAVREVPYKKGDRLLVNVANDFAGGEIYYVADYVRTNSLWWLLMVFVVVVISVAQWRGLMSLLGLAASFVVIFSVILPGIQAGYDPIVVAVAGGLIIMVVTFYLSHGLNEKTSWAVVGTLIALVITGVLASVFTEATRLTGLASEEVAFLQVIKGGSLNVRGLLLAGIMIGTLGVLDDITVSQAAVVAELKKANRRLSPREVFLRAMNVGQDHVASLVNTLVLVYTGSSLPLLLLFGADEGRSVASVVNYEIVAEEIVRTLVGSVGMVLAVPVTTFLAAYWGYKKKKVRKQ